MTLRRQLGLLWSAVGVLTLFILGLAAWTWHSWPPASIEPTPATQYSTSDDNSALLISQLRVQAKAMKQEMESLEVRIAEAERTADAAGSTASNALSQANETERQVLDICYVNNIYC